MSANSGRGKYPYQSALFSKRLRRTSGTRYLTKTVQYGDRDSSESTIYVDFFLATITQNLILSADPSSYSLTGSPATLLEDLNVNAVASSYTYTGADATLTETKNLTLSPDSYSITGISVSSARTVVSGTSSFSVTGFDATLEYVSAAVVMDAQPGSFTYTGIDDFFAAHRILQSGIESYSVTGNSASLTESNLIQADPGNYTSASWVAPGYVQTGWVGNDNPQASLIVNKVIQASSGSYSTTGSSATVTKTKNISLQTGYYTLNGANVSFLYPRWPVASQVQYGVQYGPNGDDYTGTYVDRTVKFEIETGRLVKPLSSTVALLI